jgi:hypothetical protein
MSNRICRIRDKSEEQVAVLKWYSVHFKKGQIFGIHLKKNVFGKETVTSVTF